MTLLSSSNISLIPGTTFTLKNNERVARCNFSKKAAMHTLRRCNFAFPLHRRDCTLLNKHVQHIVSATEIEVAVESTQHSSPGSGDASAPGQPKNTRPGRKSELPPVKNEELIPGAMFTGKVRAIQPFGAFVDFRASADGLVHVSRLSDSFVKDVGSVVSVGQEVKVRLIEANLQTRRISLSMREDDDDDAGKSQQQKDNPAGAKDNKSNPVRKGRLEKSKYAVGQQVEGIVKEKTPTGSVILLLDGDKGFLPVTEEPGSEHRPESEKSLLNAGDSIVARVLHFSRGQATLTLKEEDADGEGDGGTFQGEVPAPENPFLLAFRGNKEISTFLNEMEKTGTAT